MLASPYKTWADLKPKMPQITVFSQHCDDQKAKGVIQGAYTALRNPGVGWLVGSKRAPSVLIIEKHVF